MLRRVTRDESTSEAELPVRVLTLVVVGAALVVVGSAFLVALLFTPADAYGALSFQAAGLVVAGIGLYYIVGEARLRRQLIYRIKRSALNELASSRAGAGDAGETLARAVAFRDQLVQAEAYHAAEVVDDELRQGSGFDRRGDLL